MPDADEPVVGAARVRPWSSSTAARWDDGVIAGTGAVGAVVFGDPSRHVIVVAHEQAFLPANSRRPAPEIASRIPDMRAALDRRDAAAAADIMESRLRELGQNPDGLVWTDPLIPLAQLEWSTEATTSDYRREVDLDSGDIELRWRDEAGAHAGLRVRTKPGAERLDIELWSDRALAGRVELATVRERRSSWAQGNVVDYGDRIDATVERTPTVQTVHLTATGAEPGTDFAATARLESPVPLEPHARGGWSVTSTPEAPCRLVLELTTGEPRPDVPLIDGRRLLSASRLSLGGGERDDAATEQWWDRARAGDDLAERVVVETAYAAGRRNVVASTGMLPPTLQGVWSGTWAPAWSADYTLNGNLQLGPFACLLTTGLAELMPSLFRLVRPFMDDYRQNARRIFGLDGLLLPARLTTHGHANHFNREYPHLFWVGCGPWLLRLGVDYVQTTGDAAPIDEWLWDFACGILEFCTGLLAANGGTLSPSYSPENTPAGSDNPIATDATIDVAALRDAFRLGAWLAGLRGDTAKEAAWREARERLPPYRVAADGTLAEWSGEWPEQLAHRHVSQLYGLWYEPDPRLLASPLREAALETVRAKVAWRAEAPTAPPGNMEMAFGLSSIGLAAAVLGDAESAYCCALWLARDHFTPALVSTHDAGEIFNLDASGALPAVVAAMLVQSWSPGSLRVLPALPAAWRTGRVTGLTARAGVVVEELRWTPEEIELRLELRPEADWLRPDGLEVAMRGRFRFVAGDGIAPTSEGTLVVRPGNRWAWARLARIAGASSA